MRGILIIGFAVLALCGASLALAQDAPAINRADRGRIRDSKETMRTLADELRLYQQMRDEYPAQLKGLLDLNLREALPKDAWDRDFGYELSAEKGYRLTCFGADGRGRRRRRCRHYLDPRRRTARAFHQRAGRPGTPAPGSPFPGPPRGRTERNGCGRRGRSGPPSRQRRLAHRTQGTAHQGRNRRGQGRGCLLHGPLGQPVRVSRPAERKLRDHLLGRRRQRRRHRP